MKMKQTNKKMLKDNVNDSQSKGHMIPINTRSNKRWEILGYDRIKSKNTEREKKKTWKGR